MKIINTRGAPQHRNTWPQSVNHFHAPLSTVYRGGIKAASFFLCNKIYPLLVPILHPTAKAVQKDLPPAKRLRTLPTNGIRCCDNL